MREPVTTTSSTAEDGAGVGVVAPGVTWAYAADTAARATPEIIEDARSLARVFAYFKTKSPIQLVGADAKLRALMTSDVGSPGGADLTGERDDRQAAITTQ